MARPQTFSKKENEKKKQARRLEKQNRKENLTETGLYEQRKKQKDTVLKNQNINIMKEQSQR